MKLQGCRPRLAKLDLIRVVFSQMNPMKGEKNKEIEGGIEARLGGK